MCEAVKKIRNGTVFHKKYYLFLKNIFINYLCLIMKREKGFIYK